MSDVSVKPSWNKSLGQRLTPGHAAGWGKRGLGTMRGQLSTSMKKTFDPHVGKASSNLWYVAAATVAGSLLLFNKLKKLLYRYLTHYLEKTGNKETALKIINEAVVDISVTLGPKVRPLVAEIRKAHESGKLDRLTDKQLENFVSDLIEKKFDEAAPAIDRELEKMVPKLRKEILSDIRNEFIVFLFSEGIVR